MRLVHLVPILAATACVLPLAATEPAAPADPLVVVYSPIGPPLIFDDEQEQPDGLLIDIWRHIAEHMGRELRFALASWPQGVEMVRDGRADAHAALFRTDERLTYLAFSEPLLEIEARLFVPADTTWQSIEEMGAARIGLIAGSHVAETLPGQHEQPDYWHFVDPEAMVRAAMDGRIEAFVMPAPAAQFLLDKYGAEARFRPLPPLFVRSLHVAVAQDTDPDLLAAINRAILALEPEQRQRLVSHWQSLIHRPEIPGWLWTLFGGVLAAVLIVSLLVYSMLLRRRVAAATDHCEQGRQQLAALLDNLPIAVTTHDPATGRLLTANRRALDAHGADRVETLRKRRHLGTPPYSCVDGEQLLNKALAEGPQRQEWKVTRQDGSTCWEEILLQAMTCDERPVVVVAAVDITARKRIEHMQRNFIRSMAHELCTPLAIVETALANLRLQIGEQLPGLKTRFERMDRAVTRLNLVAARALAVDASAEDPVQLHARSCRPSELLEQVLAMFDHDPTTHPLTSRLPADDSALSIDSHWLGIAILNLLDNAVKYSPGGGEIHLEMIRTENGLEIAVADRGPGVDPRHRQNLFDRFYRIVNEQQVRGMGIGLYLVRLIAIQHGGTVWVEDRPGGGSRFVMSVANLPADS